MKPITRSILISLFTISASPFAAHASVGPADGCCGARKPQVEHANFAIWQAQAVEEQIAVSGALKQGLVRAAQYYEQSALLRAGEDPEGVASLRTAAQMIWSQDGSKAVSLLLHAAKWAEQQGDDSTAAQSYLDAATVVYHEKYVTPADVRRMDEWVGRAEELAASPSVSPEQRQAILARTANW